VGNVPAVFAANGFSQLRNKKDGKRHAVRNVNENVIEGNVKNGTGRISPISKITIWPIR
jgi:hypothetical protein